jgi:hypothetical protein
VNVCGIDPGRTGAIALFTSGRAFDVVDLPIGFHGVDGLALYEQLRDWKADEVFVELTHAMPKNGTKASYSQGDSNGAIRTAVQIAGMPLTWVRSVDWQRHSGLLGSGYTDMERKHRSRMRALELFPGFKHHLKRVKDHNRAEAMLIARYGVATSIMSAVRDG